jgi:quercetin dioxygenase-like cupin family protein
MRSIAMSVAVLLWMALPAAAQDPVSVDPGHHKVVFENDQVRVLRISIAPGEKTPSHEHPGGVAIFLNDSKNRVTPVGGTVDETPRKAGEAIPLKAVKHVVENLGTTKAEIILVEVKTPAAK